MPRAGLHDIYTFVSGLTLTPACSMFSLLDYHVETAQIQDNDATALNMYGLISLLYLLKYQ